MRQMCIRDRYADLSRRLDEAVQRKVKFAEAMSEDNKWLTLMKSVSGAETVSYTHLDVYKRQVVIQFKCNQLRNQFPPDCITGVNGSVLFLSLIHIFLPNSL